MTGPDTISELTRDQFVHAIQYLIADASHSYLPQPNRLDVKIYGGADGPEHINVIARFHDVNGCELRQSLLLHVVEVGTAEPNLDYSPPLG